jgi:hypothetical protein
LHGKSEKILLAHKQSNTFIPQILIVKQNFTHLNDIATIQVETDENTDQCRLALGKKIAPGRFQPGHGAVFGMVAATHQGK